MTQHRPRHIAITGASSGLGRALARHYALQGAPASLSLSGRDLPRLNALAEECRALGASVDVQAFDVVDPEMARRWIGEIDERAPVDLLIANAGISGGTKGGGETERQTREIFAVNLLGIVNVVTPILPRMAARGRGQIGLMSSLAGHRGLHTAPAYCASKAAVKAWGEGLRGQYAGHGVAVCVIMPGFVKTPMTDVNEFKMPFLMSAERAAGIIADGLALNRPRIAFPWPMAMLTWAIGMLSPRIADPFLGLLPKKR